MIKWFKSFRKHRPHFDYVKVARGKVILILETKDIIKSPSYKEIMNTLTRKRTNDK